MKPGETIEFEIVRPIEAHARVIMDWRNDPVTLQMSYHTNPKTWETFFPEFKEEYFCFPDLPPIFALLRGHRVAFLRFKPVEDPINPRRRCCDVSINVSPQFRGRGIGTACLKEIKDWIAQQGYHDIYAEVKKNNTASQKAFEQAGYTRLQDDVKNLEEIGESISICRYLAQLTSQDKPVEKKVFIVAEAGSNWRMGTPKKDNAMAQTLIDVAAEAGADAVKFQLFRAQTVYVKNAGAFDYLSKAGIKDDITSILADLAMPYEMVHDLSAYCHKVGIEFMSTAFSKVDFATVDPFVTIHKIASYELSHIHLIEAVAASGKPLFMSTGAANEEEIDWAVTTYRKLGGKSLTLLQCTASYPARPESMNLLAIPWLKNRFKVNVGLSDHSRHPTCAPVAAVALGATVIEKHFTLSNSLPGPDHAFAVTPSELKEMVHAIRKAEQMLGAPMKRVHEDEIELRKHARRGIQAIKNITKGDVFHEGGNIDILRPGQQSLGIHPKYLIELEGKPAKRDIPLGRGIQREDY